MRIHWRQGILWRSATVLLASFILTGALAALATYYVTRERAHQAADMHLQQLVAMVSRTIEVACFAKDAKLAEEVALGLLKNNEVQFVAIDALDDNGARYTLASSGDTRTASRFRLVRDIHSPFDTASNIGRVRIDGSDAAIDGAIDSEVRFAILQISALLAFAALSVGAVMLLYIVRPIKAMSDGLHQMDPMRGQQLPRPARHVDTELGRLADDINTLAMNMRNVVDKERTLRQEYHAIFENAGSGIFLARTDGTLTSWNGAFSRLLGIPLAETCAATLRLGDLRWGTSESIADLVRRCRDEKVKVEADLPLNLYYDRSRWVNLVLTPVGDNLLQGVAHDVTAHKAAEDSAKMMAITDALTGVRNRQGLEAHLREMMNTPASPFTLMMLDIDNFKRVNEGFGMPFGDALLKGMTARLRKDIKSSDCIARLGGNRFVLVLHEVGREENIGGIAERLLDIVTQAFQIDGQTIQISARLGITSYPKDGTEISELLRNAELTLERAKALGGNNYVQFDNSLLHEVALRVQREVDLRRATDGMEFELFYQPIIDLRENRLAGAEALIRWLHPEHGMASPDHFIPLAEEIGIIDDIGLWALEAACKQLVEWREQGIDRYISLNVSARQIPNGLMPDHITAVIGDYGIDPARLAIEITEGVLMSNIDEGRAWLNAIRQIGCRIYLDDFGTGYSSLSYLKGFPVDTLKVDKSFVRDMRHDSNDRTLVQAIVAMAHSLSMNVVAEGVENPEQLDMLRQMGCRYAQGYYFAKPLPIEEFDRQVTRIEAILGNARLEFADTP
jgi:diguanylate cyclase (GGDEF)-like protein/PAS domain S-box-containing protein